MADQLDGSGVVGACEPDVGRKQSLLYWLAFALLVAACSAARMAYLEQYPPQIHNDESATGIAIRVFLAPDGPWALKGASFGGHPNFGFWLSSLPSKLSGVITLWNIRFAGAVMGVLSLALMALAVRGAFGRNASLTFLLLAFPFHLHVHYSRTAFAYNHALLAAGFFFWAYVRFWRLPTRINAILMGVGVGLCMLVYSAAHVLPPALIGVFLVQWLCKISRTSSVRLSARRSLSLFAFVVLGFLMIFGAQLHEWITHGYASRAATQMIFSPGSRKHLEASVGHSLTDLQILSHSFWSTWKFFYREDSAGQYSFRGSPIDIVGAVLALCGLVVLCARAVTGNMMALLAIFSAALTVAGSIMMVEANFSPHLILFALLIPLAMAIGLDTLLKPVSRVSGVLAFVVAVGLGAWWSMWNADYYQRNVANNSKGRHVWLLHLPIDTFSIRSIANLTAKPEDLGESFFELIYPGSKRINRPVNDVLEALNTLKVDRGAGQCPCLLVVQSTLSESFASSLRSEGINFEELRGTFYNSELNASAFVVR
jgi:hypothetical protein